MELDPIGVSDTPEAAGEYDCVIGPLLHRLSRGAVSITPASSLVSPPSWRSTHSRARRFRHSATAGNQAALATPLRS